MKKLLVAAAVAAIVSTPALATEPKRQKQTNSTFQAQSFEQQYTNRFVLEVSKSNTLSNTALVAELALQAKTSLKLVAAQGEHVIVESSSVRSASDMESVLAVLRTSPLLKNSDPMFRVKTQANNTQFLHTDPGWSSFNNAVQGGANGTNGHNPRVGEFMQFIQSVERTLPATIAILDTGAPMSPTVDLDSQIIGEANFVESANFADGTDIETPTTEISHGGTVGSVISALPNNSLGIAGIDPHQKMIQIRAFSETMNEDPFSIENSIRWAAGLTVSGFPVNPNPAKVINMSFSSSSTSPCYSALQSAVDDAISAGAVLVASAGNQGFVGGFGLPANCSGVISVGALNTDGTISSFSNSGPALVVSTNGSNIPVSDAIGTNELTSVTGTSYSAPIVSGVVGAVVNLNSSLTPADVLNLLRTTGEFVQPRQATLSDNSTIILCENNSCGRQLNAVAFVEAANSVTVQPGTVKAVKAIGSDVVNVTGIRLINEVPGASVAFDPDNAILTFQSSVDGEFEIRFNAEQNTNNVSGSAVEEYFVDVTVLNGQVTQFTNPQVVQASTDPGTDTGTGGSTGGGTPAASGGGGSVGLLGLLGLSGLLVAFRRRVVK
jgi:hypothetical protein